MRLCYDEEQQLLAKMAGRFVSESSPVSRVRALRDEADPTGFSRALWAKMAELGWLGLAIPEEYGGSGLSAFELGIVIEAAGRRLMPEPFVSTVLLGANLLLLGGTEAQRARWLPAIAAGEAVVAVAYQEARSRYDLGAVGAEAVPDNEGGVRLRGDKVQVLDGHVADLLLVSARDGAGIGVYLVEAGAPGLEITRQTRVDGRNAALVSLRDVPVGAEARLGGPADAGRDALPWLQAAVDRATVGLCAEMLGIASEAFERTLAYLGERVQFGRPIGAFQSLQHRAARMFMELSLTRAAVLGAARAVEDADPSALPRMASLAKARCNDTIALITDEAVQMHGGVGMTDELDIGFYMKRARAAASTFGDAAWHRDRWARLQGY
jgi:acyl-CoA dehydrogenase